MSQQGPAAPAAPAPSAPAAPSGAVAPTAAPAAATAAPAAPAATATATPIPGSVIVLAPTPFGSVPASAPKTCAFRNFAPDTRAGYELDYDASTCTPPRTTAYQPLIRPGESMVLPAEGDARWNGGIAAHQMGDGFDVCGSSTVCGSNDIEKLMVPSYGYLAIVVPDQSPSHDATVPSYVSGIGSVYGNAVYVLFNPTPDEKFFNANDYLQMQGAMAFVGRLDRVPSEHADIMKTLRVIRNFYLQLGLISGSNGSYTFVSGIWTGSDSYRQHHPDMKSRFFWVEFADPA